MKAEFRIAKKAGGRVWKRNMDFSSPWQAKAFLSRWRDKQIAAGNPLPEVAEIWADFADWHVAMSADTERTVDIF